MARIITAGAETQTVNLEGSGTLQGGSGTAFDSSNARSGGWAFKCDSGGSNTTSSWTFGTGVTQPATGYFRAYIKFAAFPGSTVTLLKNNANAATAGIRITSGGTLQLWSGTAQVGSDSSALNLSTWYRIELFHDASPASGSRVMTARLDGTQFATGSSFTTEVASPIAGMDVGWLATPGASKQLYIDDVAINDTTGANQNSWPDAGNVVLLVPTTTSAAAAKWTDNDGTQTNMWQGAANTPPVGVAAATSPSHKYVKHAGGAAGTTDAFDATMTTYSAAGISSGDMVNVIQYLVVTGEESATGSKLLALAGVSNPTVAQGSSFDVFPSSGAQGTYPTNWQNKLNALAIQHAPSVTIATAPVMRVVRPETASRVASVAFMGMYVDYTPAPASFTPPPPYIQPNQAVQRAATR